MTSAALLRYAVAASAQELRNRAETEGVARDAQRFRESRATESTRGTKTGKGCGRVRTAGVPNAGSTFDRCAACVCGSRRAQTAGTPTP